MKVGLVRHFKVDLARELDLDSRGYSKWLDRYDRTDVIPTEVDLRGISWNKCFASDLPRAIKTARTIYDRDDIIKTSLIREVDSKLIEDLDQVMDSDDWTDYTRWAWENSESFVAESFEESQKRVVDFLDFLEVKTSHRDRVLVVCHGHIMKALEEEMKKRGFRGEAVGRPKNGELCLLER